MRPLKPAFRLNSIVGPIMLSMVLVGCNSSKSGPVEKTEGPVHTYEFTDEAQVEEAWINFDVRCEGPCPENAGTLLSRDRLSVGTCSFSLVGKDIILTNRHCVPSEIARPGESCEGVIQAIFMKNGKKDIYECDKVLSVPKDFESTQKGRRRDFAFLKLKTAPVGRTPLKISTSGLMHNEMLTAVTSTPSSSYRGPGAILVKKTCQVHMDSIIVDEFTNGFKPVVAFRSCDIVSGNSGSAMLDQAGNLKAVVQSIFSNTQNLDKESRISKRIIELVDYYKFAVGTNIICTENEELNLDPSKLGCDTGTDSHSAKVSKKMDEDGLPKEALEKIRILNDLSDFFMFTIKHAGGEDGTVLFDFEPGCIKGSKTSIPWISKYAKKDFISHSYPKMDGSLIIKIDNNARMKPEFSIPPLNSNSAEHVHFEVPVAKIAEQKQETYPIRILPQKSSPAKTLNLPMCGDAQGLLFKQSLPR